MIYFSAIFIFPRFIPEQAMEQISNPWSLLHVTLYAVLMVLLIFAFLPSLVNAKASFFNPFYLMLPGGIASLYGILD
jgi:hypothetical protein